MAQDNEIGYALVIPGVGHANWGVQEGGNPIDWAKDKPVALYAGASDGFGSDFILFEELLDLQQMSTKLNPFTGVIDGGSLSAKLSAVGTHVQPTFLPTSPELLNISSLFTRRIKEAQGILATAALTSSATTIDLWSRDGNGFSEYETIYLEDETILLTTQVSVSGEVQTFNCYRGAYGSRASWHQSHPVTGARPDPLTGWDNRVYTSWEPFGKFVYVVERDPGYVSGSKSLFFEVFPGWTRTWAGWLIRECTLNENGSILDLPIMDVFTPFFGRSLNKEPHGAQWDGQMFRAGRIFQNALAPDGAVDLEANDVSNFYGPAARGASPRVVVQIKESLISAEFKETETTDPATGETFTGFSYSVGPVIFGTEVSTVLMNSPIPDIKIDDVVEREEVYEVVVGGTAMVDSTGANYTSIVGTYNHHPLVCALTFIMSTGRGSNYDYLGSVGNYDQLSLKVGFGIPWELVDVDGIESAISDTVELKTYGWCLGYGGRSFGWGDVRAKFLTPYGYYMHPDANYNITFSKLDPITSGTTISASMLVKYSEHERLGWDDQVQSVEGSAAQPWEKGKQIIARDVAQGVQAYDPDVKDPQFKLDVSAMRPVDRRGNGEKREAVERWLEWTRRKTPVRGFSLPIPVAGTGLRPYVGKKYRISIDVPVPWRDENGDPLAIGSIVYGLVTEVSHDFNTRWYDITIACLNDQLVIDPTVISSSFRISSVTKDIESVDFWSIGVPTETGTVAQTTHTVNLPAGLEEGDLVLVAQAANAQVTMTLPSVDWESIDQDAITTVGDSGFFGLRCDGTEGATVDFVTNVSADCAWHAWRIAAGDWEDTGTIADAIDIGTGSETTGTAPDPPSNTTAWTGAYNGWLAVTFVDAAETFSAYPTGYAFGTDTTGGGATIASARKMSLADTEDPSAFTKSGSGTYRTVVYGIRPRRRAVLQIAALQHGIDYNSETNRVNDLSSRNVEIWDRTTGVVNVHAAPKSLTRCPVTDVTFDTGTGGVYIDIEIENPTGTVPASQQYIRIARRSDPDGEAQWELNESQTYMANEAEIFSDGDRGKVYT